MKKKVFLYLYPIEEYTKLSVLDKSDFEMLNETIDRRYRDKGYQIVYAMYPDKDMYGINKKETDKVIYTDITFSESTAYDGKEKEYKYPSEKNLLEQIGSIDELVVGGYHYIDCVKRVGEYALENDIDTLVDMDLTELFFGLCKKDDYFVIDSYSPDRYKEYMIKEISKEMGLDYSKIEDVIFKQFSSKIYGFTDSSNKRKK